MGRKPSKEWFCNIVVLFPEKKNREGETCTRVYLYSCKNGKYLIFNCYSQTKNQINQGNTSSKSTIIIWFGCTSWSLIFSVPFSVYIDCLAKFVSEEQSYEEHKLECILWKTFGEYLSLLYRNWIWKTKSIIKSMK